MTERKLIPCPICQGSTKDFQGVLGCFRCGVKFDGLPEDKWYVGTEADLAVANAEIASLKIRLEQVSNRHLFSVLRPGTKVLTKEVTDNMKVAWNYAFCNPDNVWPAMWEAAEEELYVNPVTNTLLKRCIEIAWERGFKGAHNGAPQALPEDVGMVIHVAFEELQRENPDLFKDLIPEQFSE